MRNPASELDAPFTDSGAWDLVASRLEDGHDVDVITLNIPRGATGYVMKIDLEPSVPRLYVKLHCTQGGYSAGVSTTRPTSSGNQNHDTPLDDHANR